MLDVEHGVNVKGGTVLLNNALVADDVAKEDWIHRGRSMSVVSAMFFRKAIQLFCFVGLLAWSDVALSQARGSVSLIRDAEIEATLRQISNPILDAAGITPDSVDLYIVRDKRLNAFVAGGQNLFLNTGLLQRTEHAGQLAGVIAHEVGHIAGGHLSRVGTAQSRATAEVILATVLGAAAAVAGNPVLGTAIITGGHTLAQGEFLSFSRSQEQQADQAAISYLGRINLSSKGLAEFFHILDEQNLLTTTRDNPYLRSHPLTRDRIRSVEAKVEHQQRDLPDFPESWDLGHQRMVVKLKAFLDDPRQTLNAFQGDTLTDRYARAIANYRLPDLEAAVADIDGLIEDYPEDPYFHELKGQMLFEHGRIDAAIEPYREANRLKPGALLRIGLARALIESGDAEAGLEAIEHLEAAVGREPTNAGAWRLLGIAQGRAGEEGEASLSLAEWALLTGKHEDAKLHARRAEGRIGPNDPGWYQLQDILRVIEES